MVTTGEAASGPDVSRLDLLSKNAAIVRDIVGKLRAEGFAGILVMASNSLDILAQIAQEASGLSAGQVIGTGTLVDTARLRSLLAKEFGIEPERAVLTVSALLQGEYGIEGVYLRTPCVVGKNGVERVVELDLGAGEREGMQASANLLKIMRQDLPEVEQAQLGPHWPALGGMRLRRHPATTREAPSMARAWLLRAAGVEVQNRRVSIEVEPCISGNADRIATDARAWAHCEIVQEGFGCPAALCKDAA